MSSLWLQRLLKKKETKKFFKTMRLYFEAVYGPRLGLIAYQYWLEEF